MKTLVNQYFSALPDLGCSVEALLDSEGVERTTKTQRTQRLIDPM
ncbi:MAG: hypothetical protein ACKPGF_24245 [Microcystis panniformis]